MVSLEEARAKSDIAHWVAFFKAADIPILRQTAQEIEDLHQREDDVSARDIASVVLNDPMMVFRVLTYAQSHKSKHQLQDLLQVEQALLMMGTNTFFQHIPRKVLVEDVLNQNFDALMDLIKLIVRSHRASHFAAEFASHLKDLHAEEVRIAALLHDLAEMLMWCFDVNRMKRILAMQTADKAIRSKVAQQVVFGFKLKDLQRELVSAFQLPPLLNALMDDDSATQTRVKNVRIAVNLARHSANGWDDAALPDDYAELAKLLHVDVARAKHLIGAP
jgi:HD-like signal output (HDOD) protein